MRTVRFWSWTCLVLAWTSTSLAQTAAPSPEAPPPAVTPAPSPAPGVSLAPDPYGETPPVATPTDPYGGPAIAPEPLPAPAPQPSAQPAPAPASTAAPAPQPYAQPAPAPQPVPAPEYDQPPTGESEADKCVLGTFCFGPVLTLGVFNPLGIGVHGRIAKHFGFAIDYQFLPSVGIEDISAGISLFTMTGRWHIGGSSFFLGAGFSYQSFWAEGTLADPITGDSAKIDASASIPQFMFGLGVLGGDGFVMGIDLAFGVPLGGIDIEFKGDAPSGNDQLETMYDSSKDSIETAADLLLELLPMTFQVNLLRIGYIF